MRLFNKMITAFVLLCITVVNSAMLPNGTKEELNATSVPQHTAGVPPVSSQDRLSVVPVPSRSETAEARTESAAGPENTTETPEAATEAETIAQHLFNKTRRILNGKEVGNTRPYMVYLRPIDKSSLDDSTWTCGGVIIHPMFILTSAACIEDANQFLVVSGTHRWIRNDETNECIEYGAKKAISKCIPKNYVFDGHMFDNTKWMRSDIAVVKVDEPFNFHKRVRGCDYIPSMISINNQTSAHEAPGVIGNIAGWGTSGSFASARQANNSQELLEVEVKIVTEEYCKSLWPPRYHHIIGYNIICSQDTTSEITKVCGEKDCMDLFVPKVQKRVDSRRSADKQPYDFEAEHFQKHHKEQTRRNTGGGFCNNDHGGPLIVGQGRNAVVAGIISACQHHDISHLCRGPFLYTSVWKYKHMINCVLGDITCPLEEWMNCCLLEDKVQ